VQVKFLGADVLRKTVHLLLVADLQASRFLPNEPTAGVQMAELTVQVQNLYFRWPKGEMFKSTPMRCKENFGCFWVLMVVENRRY